MKIYAKQVSPEYQRSPFLIEDDFPDNIVVYGNYRYKGHVSELLHRVREALEEGELAEVIKELEEYFDWYCRVSAAITDYLPPVVGKYSTNAINALKKLVSEYTTCSTTDKNRILCSVLTIMTGKKWDWKTIRGSVQSEWNEIYYPIDEWTREALERFECEYSNTGTEWIVHDWIIHEDVEAPEQPEDIVGHPVYCVSWNDEGIKKEIAEVEGVSPDEVVLYAFDGYDRVARYKEV